MKIVGCVSLFGPSLRYTCRRCGWNYWRPPSGECRRNERVSAYSQGVVAVALLALCTVAVISHRRADENFAPATKLFRPCVHSVAVNRKIAWNRNFVGHVDQLRLFACRVVYLSVPAMGVDHGGTGGTSSPEFGVGDAKANCPLRQIVPLRFRHKGTKMSVLWPSKYAKIRLRPAGLCPGPRCHEGAHNAPQTP